MVSTIQPPIHALHNHAELWIETLGTRLKVSRTTPAYMPRPRPRRNRRTPRSAATCPPARHRGPPSSRSRADAVAKIRRSARGVPGGPAGEARWSG
jgi:hypothetical protein